MGLIFWKKNKAIDQFAHNLADELFSQIQPNVAAEYVAESKKKENNLSNHPASKTINDTIVHVRQFKQVHSLGIYGKARLHLTFFERLKELGYDETTAEKINKIILHRSP